jgi:23S rRNA pseudouridine1911/1915/1917 synthase
VGEDIAVETGDDRAATTLHGRLGALYPDVSGRRIRQWLAAGRVTVNGAVVRRGDAAVAAGDRIALGRPVAPFPAALRLVHDDAHLLVIDKPPGLLTIATETERARTVYRLVRDWVEAQGQGRIFVVHRLDRETSGLLVLARSAAAKEALQAQFAARTPERVYVARVEGVVRADRGELSSRLVEDRSLRVRTVRGARRTGGASSGGDRAGRSPGGRDAISRYRVLARYRDATLLEVSLVTGRRGQIRAQLAAMGHPVEGDRAYGSHRDPLGRVCLHAARLGFLHPAGGRRVVFESAPPAGFWS